MILIFSIYFITSIIDNKLLLKLTIKLSTLVLFDISLENYRLTSILLRGLVFRHRIDNKSQNISDFLRICDLRSYMHSEHSSYF